MSETKVSNWQMMSQKHGSRVCLTESNKSIHTLVLLGIQINMDSRTNPSTISSTNSILLTNSTHHVKSKLREKYLFRQEVKHKTDICIHQNLYTRC